MTYVRRMSSCRLFHDKAKHGARNGLCAHPNRDGLVAIGGSRFDEPAKVGLTYYSATEIQIVWIEHGSLLPVGKPERNFTETCCGTPLQGV